MSRGFLEGAARFGLPGLMAGLALAWWSGGHGPTARVQGATSGTGSNDVIAFTEPVVGKPTQLLYLIDTKQRAFAVYRIEPAGSNGSGSAKLEAVRKFEYDLKLTEFNNQAPEVSAVEGKVKSATK
jgi:hypothetical protein